MPDRLTPDQRLRCMRANKSKGTKPERIMANELWHRGLRYRRNDRTVYGKPDFCFKGYKIAVFCDGDFWHGRNWPENKHRIEKSGEYWLAKIERNIQRDIKVNAELAKTGWQVLRFWTSDIMSNAARCANAVEQAVREKEISHIRRSYTLDTQYDDIYYAAEDLSTYGDKE